MTITPITSNTWLKRRYYRFYNININDYLTFKNRIHQRTRQGLNPFIIRHSKCRTERGYAFFFNRVAAPWNYLPSDVRMTISINKHIWPFKRRLREHYDEHVKEKFVSENPCTWVTCCRCPLCRPV